MTQIHKEYVLLEDRLSYNGVLAFACGLFIGGAPQIYHSTPESVLPAVGIGVAGALLVLYNTATNVYQNQAVKK